MANCLITYLRGDTVQDQDSIGAARRDFALWAARTGTALIDAGTPLR